VSGCWSWIGGVRANVVQAIAEPLRVMLQDAQPGGLPLTASFGVSGATGKNLDLVHLMQVADQTLDAAKRAAALLSCHDGWMTAPEPIPQPPARYVVDADLVDRDDATFACELVLEMLRPRLQLVVIDADSDFRDDLPDQVAAAQQRLRALGAPRGAGEIGMTGETGMTGMTGMTVELDPSDDQHWADLRTYAAWSINVDLWAEPYVTQLGSLDDCGHAISAVLTHDQARVLATELADIGPVRRSPLDRDS
jgi:hypothetical protein